VRIRTGSGAENCKFANTSKSGFWSSECRLARTITHPETEYEIMAAVIQLGFSSQGQGRQTGVIQSAAEHLPAPLGVSRFVQHRSNPNCPT